MTHEQIPQWLAEIGRRAQERTTGRPVPPIEGSIKVAKELDEAAATRLENDFRDAIEASSPDDEYDLNRRILDAVTGNRLSSKQGVRLLRSLFRKNDGGQGCQTVDAAGNIHDLDRWGAA